MGLNHFFFFFAKHLRGEKYTVSGSEPGVKVLVQCRKMSRSEGAGGGEAGTGSTKGISFCLLSQLMLSSDCTRAQSQLWQIPGLSHSVVTQGIHSGDVLALRECCLLPQHLQGWRLSSTRPPKAIWEVKSLSALTAQH